MAQLDFASYECGAHAITYWAPKAGCPLCDAERQIIGLKEAVKEVANENRLMREELARLQVKVDDVNAFRTAGVLLDDNDRAFYKSVLYQFRDESSVSLKPLYGNRVVKVDGRRKTERIVIGIIVEPRRGETWAHECTSIGGTMLAQIFSSASNSAGATQATKNMVRGLADMLPGRVR